MPGSWYPQTFSSPPIMKFVNSLPFVVHKSSSIFVIKYPSSPVDHSTGRNNPSCRGGTSGIIGAASVVLAPCRSVGVPLSMARPVNLHGVAPSYVAASLWATDYAANATPDGPTRPTPLGVHLIPKRHAFQVIQQSSPVVRQHLRVLDPFLGPVLGQFRHVILRVMEES